MRDQKLPLSTDRGPRRWAPLCFLVLLFACESDTSGLGDGSVLADVGRSDAGEVLSEDLGAERDAGPDSGVQDVGGCSPITSDTTRIDRACAKDPECGPDYVCEFGYGAVLQPLGCQIRCNQDCECPANYRCQEFSDKAGPRSWCVANETRCGLELCGADEVCCGGGNGCQCNPVGAPCLPPEDGCSAACDVGTCAVSNPLMCEEATGPVGNGCCLCEASGVCGQYCMCASGDTPIATPEGDRAIASLKVGDLIYSVDGDRIVVAPIRRVGKRRQHDHHVTRVRLATGAILEVSPGHPTADGRTFADLVQGAWLDGVQILEVELVPYREPYTYDILAQTQTGGYFAAGVFIGSTMQQGAGGCAVALAR